MLVTIPRPRMTQQGQRFDVFRLFVNQLRQVARHIDAAEPREGTKAKLDQDPHPTKRGMLVTHPAPERTTVWLLAEFGSSHDRDIDQFLFVPSGVIAASMWRATWRN